MEIVERVEGDTRPVEDERPPLVNPKGPGRSPDQIWPWPIDFGAANSPTTPKRRWSTCSVGTSDGFCFVFWVMSSSTLSNSGRTGPCALRNLTSHGINHRRSKRHDAAAIRRLRRARLFFYTDHLTWVMAPPMSCDSDLRTRVPMPRQFIRQQVGRVGALRWNCVLTLLHYYPREPQSKTDQRTHKSPTSSRAVQQQ